MDGRIAKVAAYKLAENIAEVGGEGEIAALVELLFLQAGPLAVDLAAFDAAAHDEHGIRVAVIGAAIPVFVRSAAKLAHRDQDHIVHAIAHVLPEGGQGLAVFTQQIAQLRRFVDVMVPSTDIGECHFHAHIALN